jgi:hypothetical protein
MKLGRRPRIPDHQLQFAKVNTSEVGSEDCVTFLSRSDLSSYGACCVKTPLPDSFTSNVQFFLSPERPCIDIDIECVPIALRTTLCQRADVVARIGQTMETIRLYKALKVVHVEGKWNKEGWRMKETQGPLGLDFRLKLNASVTSIFTTTNPSIV